MSNKVAKMKDHIEKKEAKEAKKDPVEVMTDEIRREMGVLQQLEGQLASSPLYQQVVTQRGRVQSLADTLHKIDPDNPIFGTPPVEEPVKESG